MAGAVTDRRRRGSVMMIAAIALAVGGLLFAGAMGLDLGRIAWEKRRLQNTVDLAALDAMRSLGRCTASPQAPGDAARDSAQRNGYLGDASASPNVVEHGTVSTVDGVRVFTPGGLLQQATAVRVALQQSVPSTLLAGAFLPGNALIQVESVASRDVSAGLMAGSFLGSIDSSNSPLLNQIFNEMLQSGIDLDAASYNGLVNANLTLQDLVDAHGGVATPEELLGVEMSAAEYFNLVANAFSASGQSAAAAAIGQFASAGVGSNIALSDFIDLATDNAEAAGGGVVNAFDLLTLGAQTFNGNNVLEIAPLAVTIPGVASASLDLALIEPPRIAIGPPGQNADGDWITEVETGQVRVGLSLELPSLNVLGVGTLAMGLDVYAEAAETRAWLEAIDCADRADPVHEARVGVEPGVARIGVGTFQDIGASGGASVDVAEVASVTIGGLLGLSSDVTVTAASELPITSSPQDLSFRGPFPPAVEEISTQTVGTPVGDALGTALDGLGTSLQLEVDVDGPVPLGITAGLLASQVGAALSPVLGSIDFVLEPVFQTLGLHVGGADVSIVSLAAEEAQPRVVR